MATDDRIAVIPFANWHTEWSDINLNWNSTSAGVGFRPISAKFMTSVDTGPPGPPYDEAFSSTYVRNVASSYAPTFNVVHHKTVDEVIKIATDSGNTSHPLRCISLNSYFPLDASGRRYSAIFVENTGAYAKPWWWWFNVSPQWILSETDQNKKDKQGYPIRLVHISPVAQPVGQPWNFDIIAVSNTGADSRWWWWNYNMTRDGVQKLLYDHAARNPRVYQLANGNVSAQNQNIWTAILVESGSSMGWYDPDKTYDELMTLASQRNARILDLVNNYTQHSGFAATMLKCS